MLSTLSVLNHASDVVEAELLGSNEAKIESACTTDSEKGLKQDFQLILQEHSGNIVKKWGNSEQWVLELRDRRRVAVPIQIPPPQCEAIKVLEEQKQLALVLWESSEAINGSTTLIEEDEVLVEDWVSDTYLEDANPPLAIEPLAFSLPSAMVEQSFVDEERFVGVDNSERQVPYSGWFQRRFNNFNSFLGTSLEGLEDQATKFLLAVEAELKRRAEVNKITCGFKSSGVKGLRELKGLFSSINYGSTSARRSGSNRDRVLFVAQ